MDLSSGIAWISQTWLLSSGLSPGVSGGRDSLPEQLLALLFGGPPLSLLVLVFVNEVIIPFWPIMGFADDITPLIPVSLSLNVVTVVFMAGEAVATPWSTLLGHLSQSHV